jgi:replicative DNA helicase
MSEIIDNTFTAYLGPEFQQKLMWQLLVEPEFAEKTIPNLAVEYFDDPNLKRLFIIIHEFFKEYEKVPNLQNQSIQQAINEFKTPNNTIEEESLNAVIKRIELWNERVLNKQMLYDGDAVRKATNNFIKQQEYRKIGEFIIEKTKNGEIKNKQTLGFIEERFQKTSCIGSEEDDGTDVFEGIEKVLRKEFRETIPTGVDVIDSLTGGGLGKGEFGLILTPTGVGKTTLLTKIANTAYDCNKNVLQIIFEDTVEQIQRKHFTIWSGVALSKMDDESKVVEGKVYEKAEKMKGKGRLVIIRMNQENTTMMDVRAWIARHQKKFGYKFDIVVLDYLDCLESHKKTPDRNEAELVIVKSFEAMASDLDIPAWSALQTNRSGINAELVEAYQTGGNIKRVQKAHFFMSVAKTPDQKEANLANIRIIKARFAKDGQTFEDCTFNNDTMQIIIQDKRYPLRFNRRVKGADEEYLGQIEDKAEGLSGKIPINNLVHVALSDFEANSIGLANAEDMILGDLKDRFSAMEGVTGSTVTQTEGIIEIDETIPVEKVMDDVAGGNAEGVTGKDDDLINWTGETFTVNTDDVQPPEVRLEDVATEDMNEETEGRIKFDPAMFKPPGVFVRERDTTDDKSIFELESALDDTDDSQEKHKTIKEALDKMRKNQEVIKKKSK